MNLRKTSLLSVVLLSATPFPDPNLLHSIGKDMHEALVFAVRSAEPKQLSLQFIPAPEESDVLLQCPADDRRSSHTSSLLGLSQVLEVPSIESDRSGPLNLLHSVGAPSVTGSNSSLPTVASGNRKEPYTCHINDLHGSAENYNSGTTVKIASFPPSDDLMSSLPSPGYAKGQADSKRLALDFILGPKSNSLAERVCARLIQSEAHETHTSLRSDYRQAFICVSLASKGNTEPFLSSSYAMYGIHPDKVWLRIVANRKERLGREYYEHFDSNDMPRPDVPKFKKPPVYEPEPNERIAALISGLPSPPEAGEEPHTDPIAPSPALPNSQKERLA